MKKFVTNVSLKALILSILIVYLGLAFVFAFRGIPGLFDPSRLEYGKGPQIGEEYACSGRTWFYPCTKQQYWAQTYQLAWLVPLFLIFFEPYALVISFGVGIVVYFVIVFFDKECKKRRSRDNNL